MGCSVRVIRGLVQFEVYENPRETTSVSVAIVACDDPSSPQMAISAALNVRQGRHRDSYLHKTRRTVSEGG